MADFKPEIVQSSNLPRGFRPVRLNLNNQSNQTNENIYDEPYANFETNQHQIQPPPIPSTQPPSISYNQQNIPVAQPFWSLPSQEQEQLQHHLQQHLSRSPTPTFGQINADNIQKVITDKEPPSNAEFLYETDSYKFYTIPANGNQRVVSIKQQNNVTRRDQGFGGPPKTVKI